MYERILVALDDSEPSRLALAEALALARLTGATLRLVHAVEPLEYEAGYSPATVFIGDVMAAVRENGRRLLADAQEKAGVAGVPSETALLESFATPLATRILDEASRWRAQLLVIGTHGRSGIPRLLLGSDAEKILRLAPVPVLLVRHPG